MSTEQKAQSENKLFAWLKIFIRTSTIAWLINVVLMMLGPSELYKTMNLSYTIGSSFGMVAIVQLVAMSVFILSLAIIQKYWSSLSFYSYLCYGLIILFTISELVQIYVA